MSFDPKIYRRVVSFFDDRRQKNEVRLSRLREEIHRKLPEVAEIDRELKTTVAQIARAALDSPGDPKPIIDSIREHNLSLISKRAELLVASGYPADALNPAPRCKLCGDTGFIINEPCKCFLQEYAKEQAKELSSLLNIKDQNFENFNFDYYANTPDSNFRISPYENRESIFDQCSEYARNFGRHSMNLIFSGPTGLGKTFLSGCIAGEVAGRGFSVVYDTVINLLSAFEKDKFGNSSEQSDLQLRRYFACDLLIIDDLGTEMTTSFTNSAFYDLINTRIMEHRPIIINTNMGFEELRARYTPPIVSRLEGEFRALFFFGRDIRLIKKEQAPADRQHFFR